MTSPCGLSAILCHTVTMFVYFELISSFATLYCEQHSHKY